MIPWKYVLSGLLALGFSTSISDWRSIDPAVLEQMQAEVWAELGGTGEFTTDELVDALVQKGREAGDETETSETFYGEFDLEAYPDRAALRVLVRAALRGDAEAMAELEALVNP